MRRFLYSLCPNSTYIYIFYINIYVSASVHLHVSHIFFIHLCVDGHLGCFQSSAIVSCTVINMDMHVLLPYDVFNSFGNILWSGVAGSNGISIFRSFRKVSYWFPQFCVSSLHSHQHCRRISFTHTLNCLLFFVFLMIAIPNGVR